MGEMMKMGGNGEKWGGMEKNGGKWGIHEQIPMEIYIRTSGIWRRWGKIGERTNKNGGILEQNAKTHSNNTCVDYNHGGGIIPLKQNDS